MPGCVLYSRNAQVWAGCVCGLGLKRTKKGVEGLKEQTKYINSTVSPGLKKNKALKTNTKMDLSMMISLCLEQGERLTTADGRSMVGSS